MKTRSWTAFAIAIAVMVTMGIAVQPAVADSPSMGKQVFDKHCAKCHGDDGSGKTKIGEKMGLKELGSAEVQELSDEQLATIVADGQGKMPGYSKKLSGDEIKAVVEQIRSFGN